jgi:hypothetical protein
MNYNREEPQPHDGWQDENPLYREQVPLVPSPQNQTLDFPGQGRQHHKRANQAPVIIVPPADITINQYNNTRGGDSSPRASHRETRRYIQRQPVHSNFLQLDFVALVIACMIIVVIIGGLIFLSLFSHILSQLGI